MDKMKMETLDLTQANIEKLAVLFPSCITEIRGEDGKLKKAVNFELLRQLLSDVVLEGNEAYEFIWVGKKAAIVEAARPIRKTLRPCPKESVNWDSTENLYIEGDNLEVLKLLQESYLGKVKMIYIDPPYNTGNDYARYKNPDNDPKGPWISTDCTAQAGHGTKDQFYDMITLAGRVIKLQPGLCWRYTKAKMDQEIAAGHIWFGTDGQGVPRKKTYLCDRVGKTMWMPRIPG